MGDEGAGDRGVKRERRSEKREERVVEWERKETGTNDDGLRKEGRGEMIVKVGREKGLMKGGMGMRRKKGEERRRR